MASGIYKITNKINGHCYIGSAINVNDRWKRHCRKLNKNCHENRHLQNAWNKYGIESFAFSIIQECSIVDLVLFEQKYIDSTKPEYNIAKKAYSTLGVKYSKEVKDKLSKIAKAIMTPEHRAKLSIARKAIMTPEFRKKISEATTLSMTPERRAEISKLQKDRMTPDARANLSNKARARVTPEYRKKMSQVVKKIHEARREKNKKQE